MKADKYSIEGGFGTVLKRLAIKLRNTKEDNLTADLVNAAARLLGKYNDFLKIQNEIDTGTNGGSGYYESLEDGTGCIIPEDRR